MASQPASRPLLLLIAILVLLTALSAVFSAASFRAVRASAQPDAVIVDAPAELRPAIGSNTTRPWNRDDERTSSTPSVAPATVAPAPTETPLPPQRSADLILGQDATPPSSTWTKPAIGQTRSDPAYGLPVTRITTADGTRFNRNTYSRRQAENADGSAFLTYHGESSYNVYDSTTLKLLAIMDIHPDGEPQWHPTNPDRIRHVAGPNSYVGELMLYESSVSTGDRTVIADLTSDLKQIFPAASYMIDRAEGSPSADGNRFAWIVYNDDENPIGIVSYDLANDKILGTTPVDPSIEYRLDWVSASPSGTHVMAGYWEETIAYTADMTNERVLFRGGEHSDIMMGANGNDTYVYIDFTASVNGGWLMAVDLVTEEATRLFDLYDDANTSIHVSGKAYDRPGWVVLSTYSCKDPGAWSCHKVFALDISTGTIVNLAHSYNCGDDYWTETHAVTNRDLSRIYFNSDGGSCGIDAEVYRIDVPSLG